MKKRALLALLPVLLLLFSACGREEIVYLPRQSAVTSVTVESGRLTLTALITLKNTTREDLTFTMTGDFPALLAAGTVADSLLPVADSRGFSEQITLPARSTRCLTCTFRGTLTGAVPQELGAVGFSDPPGSLAFEFVKTGYTEDD